MKRHVDKYALLSVSDKTGLAPFAKALAKEFGYGDNEFVPWKIGATL